MFKVIKSNIEIAIISQWIAPYTEIWYSLTTADGTASVLKSPRSKVKVTVSNIKSQLSNVSGVKSYKTAIDRLSGASYWHGRCN